MRWDVPEFLVASVIGILIVISVSEGIKFYQRYAFQPHTS